MDAYGGLLPAVERFPSSANGAGFKPLDDYVHAKGLQFGIHLMRGIPRQAVKENTPILGSDARAPAFRKGDLIAWVADVPRSKDKYLAIFNLGDIPAPAPVELSSLGFTGDIAVTNTSIRLTQNDARGTFAPSFRRTAPDSTASAPVETQDHSARLNYRRRLARD